MKIYPALNKHFHLLVPLRKYNFLFGKL